MSRHSRATPVAALFALAAAAAAAACGNPFALPPAVSRVVDTTFTLWAITGTPVSDPSAFDMVNLALVRTDVTYQFDFVLDMRTDSLGDTVAVLIPPGGLGLNKDAGLQITTTPFDSIRSAPGSGYDQSAAQKLAVGTVVLASSRIQACNYNYSYPLYAKLQVLVVDKIQRRATFHMLLDPNCGYRSLVRDSLPPSN